MNAIILAAGTGSRLGARTATVPKPALRVGGHPLLAYAVAFARAAGSSPVAVITGHLREVSEPLARALGADHVLWNPQHATAGNLLSLAVARAVGLCDGAFLLMNADHIYRPSIAPVISRVAAAASQITAFVDRDRELGADDMKVQLDAQVRITAIAKTLATWDAGYVGMTFVPAGLAPSHLRTSDEVLATHGPAAHVEAVLARLAGTPSAAHSVDISGHGWLEVDDERDLAHAEAALASTPWYDELPV